MLSLLDLIARGSIGGIGPGSTVDDVRLAFGEPSDTSVSRNPTILKFGALEVTLRLDIVELLHIELDQALPAFLDAAGLSMRTRRDELAPRLARHGIQLEPYALLTFTDGQTAVRAVPANVLIVFNEADRLLSISHQRTDRSEAIREHSRNRRFRCPACGVVVVGR